MSLVQLLQILIYDLVDVSICVILVLIPFREKLCSRQRLCLLSVILYLFVVLSRVLSQTGVLPITAISVIRITVYILLFSLAVHSSRFKRIFVLMVMLNYTSFIMILFHFFANFLFAQNFTTNPYSFRSSFLLVFVFTICFPLIYWMMNQKIRPLINQTENTSIWNYIWLIPATFCTINHYNVLANNGVMAFSKNWYNVVFSLIIYAGSLLVAYMLIKLVEESNLNLKLKAENYQLSIQEIQYENLKNRIEETRIVRHDMRHNMTLIKSYLDDCNYDEMRNYIQQYFNTLSLDSPVLYCDDYALNAVVSYYDGIAKQQEIKLLADIQYPKASAISDTDKVVLIGNLLENAVEACSRQKENRRFINLCLKQENEAVILTLDNSFDGIITRNGNGFLSSKNNFRGTGILSIKKIVGNYHGIVTFDYDDSIFFVSIMLPLI